MIAKPVNDAPTAMDDVSVTDEDTPVTIDLLANDSDMDSASLSPVIVTGPMHGTVVVIVDGTIRYTSTTNYSGPDSFTYRVSDGIAQSALATVSLSIRARNDAPPPASTCRLASPVQAT